ncbi:MAG: YebC/PmpR family DNA-binding transcriptional regulator [Flavobacteriales bacterium]
MGRAFEFRKARKMKRWGAMAKTFTRLGRQISMAVKAGGPDPESNAMLRAILQNCKAANMPKENIENAIKKASSKEEKDLDEVVYEGYGPFGVAIVVETATDNPTRTVANIRMYFNRADGALGKTGSLDFIFNRKSQFRIKAEGVDMEDLELELIDYGLEEIYEEDGEIVIIAGFTDFGAMQKALEEKDVEIINSELVRIPTTTVELTDEQAVKIQNLIEKIEDDDDVQQVFHNMA